MIEQKNRSTIYKTISSLSPLSYHKIMAKNIFKKSPTKKKRPM